MNPLVQAVDPDRLRGHPHGSQTLEVLQSLENDCSLKNEKHEQGHQGEVPILIQEPKTWRKELEHEKWCDHMLLIDWHEVRDWDAHLVGTPDQVDLLDTEFIWDALDVLVMTYGVIHWVGDHGERLAVLFVNELFLLNFHLEWFANFTIKLDRLDYQGCNEGLLGVLFLVGHFSLDVGALSDLIIANFTIGIELVGGDRPKVEEQQHSIHCHSQNEAASCEQILLISHLPAKLIKHKSCDCAD